jgi:plasmid stabilization system protein ParE
MNYTVVCKPDAEALLADIWMRAPDRAAVSRAAHAIEQLLGRAPHDQGESREEGFRVCFEPPLGVTYYVSEDDRRVEIIRIWAI